MAISLARLGGPTRCPAETTLYTAAAKTLVKDVLVANTGATDRTFSVSVVPAGGAVTVGDSRIARDLAIPANDTVRIELGEIMNVGDYLSCQGSHNDLIFRANGVVGVP